MVSARRVRPRFTFGLPAALRCFLTEACGVLCGSLLRVTDASDEAILSGGVGVTDVGTVNALLCCGVASAGGVVVSLLDEVE